MTEHIAHTGAWGIALIIIVIASWLLYRYLAPKTWKEWASAGVVQAFIIALYAEMYGFPLTIYLLSGWLTTRFPDVNWLSHDAGHLLEVFFGWKVNPHFGPFHLLSFVFIFAGFALLARAWPVLYRAQRQGGVATTGPYAHVRHPQYLGFVAVMFGFLLQWPTLLTVLMFPVLMIAYGRLARAEERDSLERFGESYRRYMETTPAFWPKFRPLRALAARTRP